MTDVSEPARSLELLNSGLAARVLARHFAIRKPGSRDARLGRELLAIVEAGGREILAQRFRAGLQKERDARSSSAEARVHGASSDVTRARAIVGAIVEPQAQLTRRPELLIRLAATLEDAHDVARMVTDLHVARPANLTADGSLLERAGALRRQSDESKEVRERATPDHLLAALAEELDHAADFAASLDRGAKRVLALERCFEASRQIRDIVTDLGDQGRAQAFTNVFARLVQLNRLLGPSSVESEQHA